MVGQEGRSYLPVLKSYTDAGFDPEKDLLQSYMMIGGEPHSVFSRTWTLPYLRTTALCQPRRPGDRLEPKDQLEGLYAAGNALYAANYYHHAAATGRYVGRKAAEYALKAGAP